MQKGIENCIWAGISRIALVLRHTGWADATEAGLTLTQRQILAALASRKTPMFVTQVADELVLTKPTVSDSVSTLVRKGLVAKMRSADDARAVELRLTSLGEQLASNAGGWPVSLLDSTIHLNSEEKVNFLRGLIKMVYSLQQQGLIPLNRMCLTCSLFGPEQYSDQTHPHHCGFTGAPFSNEELQIDCREHQIASEERRAELWAHFAAGASK
jgi:DNA-binding MarR family transcriptional regulator